MQHRATTVFLLGILGYICVLLPTPATAGHCFVIGQGGKVHEDRDDWDESGCRNRCGSDNIYAECVYKESNGGYVTIQQPHSSKAGPKKMCIIQGRAGKYHCKLSLSQQACKNLCQPSRYQFAECKWGDLLLKEGGPGGKNTKGDEGTAISNEIKQSMTRYVDKKVKDLSNFEQYVCKDIGRDPGAFECWDDHGNQKKEGGNCQSPKNCLIYSTPAFNMNNKVQSWTGNENYGNLKNGLFQTWGLTKSALDEVEMATLMEKGKFVDIHVYTETNKGTGAYKFELAAVETHPDGNVKSIGYINIQSKGWIIKPRTCIRTKTKKSGFLGGTKQKRACKERGLRGEEIAKMRKTLELYAFKSIHTMIGGSTVQAPPCKKEFNCYCYMERNNGKVPSGGKEECKNAYEHFMTTGKKQGLKGTCCAAGAQISNPTTHNDAQIMFDGRMCKKGINWQFDNGKKEINVWGGCKATFECNGDAVKCESQNCPEEGHAYRKCRTQCGVNADDDRRRRRRRRLSQIEDHHTMCKKKCGISYHDDDGWDHINEEQAKCVGACIGCFENCVGCSSKCKCNDVKVRRRLTNLGDDGNDREGILDRKSHFHFKFPENSRLYQNERRLTEGCCRKVRKNDGSFVTVCSCDQLGNADNEDEKDDKDDQDTLNRISRFNFKFPFRSSSPYRNRINILKNDESNLWLTSTDDDTDYESRGRRYR